MAVQTLCVFLVSCGRYRVPGNVPPLCVVPSRAGKERFSILSYHTSLGKVPTISFSGDTSTTLIIIHTSLSPEI